jgi:ABC-type uncharacterized transport system permease subunit
MSLHEFLDTTGYLAGACAFFFAGDCRTSRGCPGRGFIALAALIMGRWRPLPTAIAAAAFGLCEYLQLKLQDVSLFGFGVLPGQLVQAIPYVVTLIVLMGFLGDSRAPKALGQL